MSIYITDCRANPRTWGSINLYEHRVIYQNHTRHNPWIIMNHQILGFPNQLQQPLPQPLPTILSEAFILFSQQRHLQDPWKGLERQNMAEHGRTVQQVQNPRVNFFARFQYVSIIFEPASSKESFYQPSYAQECLPVEPPHLIHQLLHFFTVFLLGLVQSLFWRRHQKRFGSNLLK